MLQTRMHFISTEDSNQYSNLANKLHYNLFCCNLSSNSDPVNPILEATVNSHVDRVLFASEVTKVTFQATWASKPIQLFFYYP
jgi:hypothetical protein